MLEGLTVALLVALLAWLLAPFRTWWKRGFDRLRYFKWVVNSVEDPSNNPITPIVSRYDIPKRYVVPRFVVGGGQTRPAGSYLFEWCDSRQSSPLLIHGPFGSGKTALSLYLTYHLALRGTKRPWRSWLLRRPLIARRVPKPRFQIPVYIHIKELSTTSYSAIQGHFEDWLQRVDRSGTWGGFHDFIRDENIVLILDGLDQLDPTGGQDRLRRLVEFVHFHCSSTETKVLITARSDFLRESTVLSDLLKGRLRRTPEERPLTIESAQSVEIAELSEREVLELIRAHPSVTAASAKPESVYARVTADIHLAELARNPLLLNMFLVTGLEMDEDWGTLDVCDLFRGYIDYWVREDTQLVFLDSVRDRRLFVEDLAVALLREGIEALPLAEISSTERSIRWEERARGAPSRRRYYGERTRSFLLINRDGSFMFAHRSFAEYFCGQFLVRKLRDGQVPAAELLRRLYSNLVIWFMRCAVGERDYSWLFQLVGEENLVLRRLSYALLPAIVGSRGMEVAALFREQFHKEEDFEAKRHCLYGIGWLGGDPCDEEFLRFILENKERWIHSARDYYHTVERQRAHCLRRLLAFSSGDREFYAARGLYILDLSHVGRPQDIPIIEEYADSLKESNDVVRGLASDAVAAIRARHSSG